VLIDFAYTGEIYIVTDALVIRILASCCLESTVYIIVLMN